MKITMEKHLSKGGRAPLGTYSVGEVTISCGEFEILEAAKMLPLVGEMLKEVKICEHQGLLQSYRDEAIRQQIERNVRRWSSANNSSTVSTTHAENVI